MSDIERVNKRYVASISSETVTQWKLSSLSACIHSMTYLSSLIELALLGKVGRTSTKGMTKFFSKI